MTEAERPNFDDGRQPAPDGAPDLPNESRADAGGGAATPPPPPEPFVQPPLPGEAPGTTRSPLPAPIPVRPPEPTGTCAAPSAGSCPPPPASSYPPPPAGSYPPPPAGASAPHGQQPYQASGGPQSPYSSQPPYPPQPPYPSQLPYPAAEPPQRKIWPWVLGGCLLAFLLGIGGCVGCVSCATIMYDRNDAYNERYADNYDYDYDYDNDYGYDYGYQDSSRYTLEDIKDIVGTGAGTVENETCTEGVYTVGKDIEPGLYFLEGSQTTESGYIVFDEEGVDSYSIDDTVVYFGNYLAELDRGDVIAYMPRDEALHMYPIAKAAFSPEAPYRSGLYRVGTDIPAGTYTVTVQEDAAANTDNDSGVFVMKDLDFDDDSITETKYVIAGGSQTVTVKQGDYLELFAAIATPAEPAST